MDTARMPLAEAGRNPGDQFLEGVDTLGRATIDDRARVFHLTGTAFEPVIDPTLQALREIGPQVIVPQHCTGWRATMQIAQQLPEAFIPTSVGTRFSLS